MVRAAEVDAQETLPVPAALAPCVPGQPRAWAWRPGVLSPPQGPPPERAAGCPFSFALDVLGSASPPPGVARGGHRENTAPTEAPALVPGESL